MWLTTALKDDFAEVTISALISGFKASFLPDHSELEAVYLTLSCLKVRF